MLQAAINYLRLPICLWMISRIVEQLSVTKFKQLRPKLTKKNWVTIQNYSLLETRVIAQSWRQKPQKLPQQ